MLFIPLLTQAKRDDDDVHDSITDFLMFDCECLKSSNGYYHWNSVALKCKDCEKASSMPLKCQNMELKTRVYQFEITDKP